MAQMSSIYDDDSTADRAVRGSCLDHDNWDFASATTKEKYPGWKIDLKKFYFVKSFVVTAHKYSNGAKRFNNAFAFILGNEQNLLDNDIDFTKACYIFSRPAKALEEVVFPCQTFGRFVSIVLRQNSVWLEICHVSVYGTSLPEVQLDPNMAWQSSNYDKLSVASNAVTKMRSCSETGQNWASSTDKQKNPAWAIDLKVVLKIEIVVVTARNDLTSDKYERFYHAYSLASHQKPNLDNIDFQKKCFLYYGPAARLENVIFYCKSLGRYLTIALQQENQNLEMCHLRIYSLPLNGNWSPWSQWSECSTSCGPGSRTRERTCDNPAPTFGGQKCRGDSVQKKNCNEKICPPIDGNWSEWKDASECCEDGKMKRERKCDNPPPEYGGSVCKGDAEKIVDCKLRYCPKNIWWICLYVFVGLAILASVLALIYLAYKKSLKGKQVSSLFGKMEIKKKLKNGLHRIKDFLTKLKNKLCPNEKPEEKVISHFPSLYADE